MLDGGVLLPFVAATALMLAVPGPSVLYVVARSVEQGRAAGIYSMLGLETGAMIHVLAAAGGLAALLASCPPAFTTLKIAGAGYLLYLGIRQFRTRPVLQSSAVLRRSPRRDLYCRGVLVDLLNPKTALFFVAFLPQFVDPARGSVATQMAVLGMLFVALAAVCDGSYALVAGGLAPRIGRSLEAQSRINVATGGVYVGLAGMAVLV